MWQSGKRWWRVALVLLLVAMPAQFALFYRDYTTDYRIRSARWFGGGDTHRAMIEARRLAPGADPASSAAYVTPAVDEAMAARIGAAGWRSAATVGNLDGEVAFVVGSNQGAAHAFVFTMMPLP